jgi:diaminohydroxyphosphoribosylaminopyrimidine deaminase / 5-amino-6-(5-phosphoribosylamino)uracil reductase
MAKLSSDTDTAEFDRVIMRRAIELAAQAQGYVEPNPMVGCVVVKNQAIIAEGYHQRFGEAHAEVNALNRLTPDQRVDSTIYVTLEPCTHRGKTPPCIDLVIASKPKRVVVGARDPFPLVSGSGISKLREAGIQVDLDVEYNACQRLIAPFAKRQKTSQPWVIAKWAMTLDGRMATHAGDSKWITNETARAHAHRTRGRVDAIIIGIGTAIQDDPMLNARPSGPRIARRIVLDSSAKLPWNCKLATTAKDYPTCVACGPAASPSNIASLRSLGCEVWKSQTVDCNERFKELLEYLSEQGCTSVVIDGGPKLLGSLFDHKLVDETHVYLGSQLVGGIPNLVPNLGRGATRMNQAIRMSNTRIESLDGDFFIAGDCVYD